MGTIIIVGKALGNSPFNLEEHEMFYLTDPNVGKNELGEEKTA